VLWGPIVSSPGESGGVQLFSTSELAFAWVQSRIRLETAAAEAPEGRPKRTHGVTERLTLEWLRDHSRQHLIGANGKWGVTAWNNVVYLKISERWTPEEGDVYVEHLTAIPGMLGSKWGRVFFLLDISDMTY
jgi:hypothetical protein